MDPILINLSASVDNIELEIKKINDLITEKKDDLRLLEKAQVIYQDLCPHPKNKMQESFEDGETAHTCLACGYTTYD